MRKILTLCGTGILLTGCESDFDKCMRTELPRASNDLGLEDARQTLVELNTALKKNQIAKSAADNVVAWDEANPAGFPEYADYKPPYYLRGNLRRNSKSLLQTDRYYKKRHWGQMPLF